MPTPILKAIGALEYFADLLRLRRQYGGNDVILHWQWIPFPWLAIPLLRLIHFRGTHIFTAHDILPHHQIEHRLATHTSRLRFSFAHSIVVHGDSLRQQLLSLDSSAASRIKVIPHGLNFEQQPAKGRISARQSLHLPGGHFLIGFVGLLRPHKGLGDLVDAWTALRSEGGMADCTLVVAGELRTAEWQGEEKAALQNIMTAIANDDQIVFLPEYLTDEVFLEVLNALDLLVLPYRHASQSGVALAALRFGVPMIVSPVGALPDVIPESERRWIVDTSNPLVLAQSIKAFLATSPDEQDQYRSALKSKSEALTWESLSEHYEILYRETLGQLSCDYDT